NTDSVDVSTASATRKTRVSTTDDITMAETLVYIRKSASKDKGKGKIDESEPVQTKTKLQQEQERLGYEAAMRLQAELEKEERVEADKELAQRLQAEEREMYIEAEQARMLLRGYSFDEIKTLFETTIRRVNTFVPIESKVDRAVPELAARSLKRDAEEELDQESSKRDDLVILWSLVKERFNSIEPTDDKEREIWVELKRLFKPDTDDELWKLQKNIYDLTWRLYDSCGVHHVSIEKGIDIYMLVEKEYPLSRGTLTQMLVAKLLVEQDNEMSRELLRKIFMQVERLRK
ncbi:hypothetical protein Tco_1405506, partial [Tanacetum coccineum]